MIGSNIVQETTNKISLIRERMCTAPSRQKSYADKRRKPLEFQEGEHVFLRVNPKTGVRRSVKVRKLNPYFMGPFQILKRVEHVAYQLTFPPQLSNLHDVFHVSQLRKYILDISHVIAPEPIQLKSNLTFKPNPVQIIGKSTKSLRNKTIMLVKMDWEGLGTSKEATFKLEEVGMRQYPDLAN